MPTLEGQGGDFAGSYTATLQRLNENQYVELMALYTAAGTRETLAGSFGFWIVKLA